MGVVYVVQKPKPGPKGFLYDISPAMSYGQIVFIFEADEQTGLKPGPSMFKAKHQLNSFCDQDYLLWAGGDPSSLTIASLAAADANMGRINFLRWERERIDGQRTSRGFYMPVQITLRGQL